MKTVQVTGGDGLISSNFISHFLSNPSFSGTIITLDKLTYAGNLESRTYIPEILGGKRYCFEQVDICDNPEVPKVLKRNMPEP